jgi:hypothetical protein
MALPKHLSNKINPTTRARSTKQEKKIVRDFSLKEKARVTKNSGATFGENDIITDRFEIEAKTTAKKSFTIKVEYWEEVKNKCKISKIPLMVIEFEGKESLVVMSYKEFMGII